MPITPATTEEQAPPPEAYTPGTYSTDEPATYPLGEGSGPEEHPQEDPFAHVNPEPLPPQPQPPGPGPEPEPEPIPEQQPAKQKRT